MADPVCYTIGNDYVSSTNQYFPCGSNSASGGKAQPCCFAGDYCLEDSICQYTRGGVLNGTGYYMAGCTDSSWADLACPKQCSSEYGSDIIYNSAEANWNCCSSGKGFLNCQQPSNLVVDAPAPSDLSTILHLSTPLPSSAATTGIATASTSHTAIPSSSSPARKQHSSTPAMSASTPLSTGAKAGIGVAVIAGFLLLFGGGYLFYQRNKRRHEKFQPFSETDSHYSHGNRSHTTIGGGGGGPRSMDTRRETFASRTTQATAGLGRSAGDRTNRNTYASSYYNSEPGDVVAMREVAPPLPEGADGIQVVKQLPRTPGKPFQLSTPGDHNEKIAVEEEEPQGPFEMNDEEYELQARRQNMQELEGTTVARAELDAVSKRTSSDGESVERMAGVERNVSEPSQYEEVELDVEQTLPSSTYRRKGDGVEGGDGEK